MGERESVKLLFTSISSFVGVGKGFAFCLSHIPSRTQFFYHLKCASRVGLVVGQVGLGFRILG